MTPSRRCEVVRMPTDREITEHQAKHPVRVWGVSPSATHDPCRWGDIAVVPFYDHVDAIKAAEQRARREPLLVALLVEAKLAANANCTLTYASVRDGYEYHCKCGWKTHDPDETAVHNAQALATAINSLRGTR